MRTLSQGIYPYLKGFMRYVTGKDAVEALLTGINI